VRTFKSNQLRNWPPARTPSKDGAAMSNRSGQQEQSKVYAVG
jgi:hypothetical protein